jgi:protein transport protein SEC24
VDALLTALPTMFAGTRNMEAALGPALDAAFHIMQHIGGKMVVCSGCLPTLGAGKLKPREGPKMLGSDKEHSLLAPEAGEDGAFYKTKAVDFSKQQISVDMFVHAQNYADVATLGALSRYTAGQVYYYPSLALPSDRDRLYADMVRDLTRTTGFEAVMRVRCTKGVNITNFYGNFFIRGTDLLALPNVTPDTAFNVELAHEEPLQPGGVIAVQAALLYTTSSGERRICIHTLAKPVTTNVADLYRNVDADAVANMLAKMALDQALRQGLAVARRYLHRAVLDLVRAWRTCQSSPYGLPAGVAPSGMHSRMPMQMPGMAGGAGSQGGPGGGGAAGGAPTASDISTMLPDALQLLPLYAMGLQKSPTYRGGEFIRSDERAFLVYRMLSMPIAVSRVYIYPRLFNLHEMEAPVGRADPSGEVLPPGPFTGPRVVFPNTVTLSASVLSPGGCYLLDNGVELYLWVGREAPQGLVNALFGLPSLEGQDPSALQLVEQGNDYSARVCAIVRCLRAGAAQAQKVRVVREGAGDVNEARFHWHLVEDRQQFQGGTFTYAEYAAIVFKEAQMAHLGGGGPPQ